MPDGNRAELLYVLARLSEFSKDAYSSAPVPLRGLEDTLVLLEFGKASRAFPALLIGDNWYSDEMLDAIVYLRERGHIGLEPDDAGNHAISLKVSAKEAIKELQEQVKMAEYDGLLSELRDWAIKDDLHDFVTRLLKEGQWKLRERIECAERKDKTGGNL